LERNGRVRIDYIWGWEGMGEEGMGSMKKRVYRGVYPLGMNRAKVVELFKSGYRPYEIAKVLRISHQAVYAILKSERAKGNLKK
jgi:hypothetical protein